MKDTVNAALAATVQAKTEAVRRAIEYFAARSAEGVFDDIEDAW